MRTYRLRPIALSAALALLLAGSAGAYNIILKDGSIIVAKSKYQVQNGRAIITLPNGTQSFIDAAQIDVAKTNEANKDNYGSSTQILNTQVLPTAETGPPPVEQKRLTEMAAARRRDLPASRRQREEAATGAAVKLKGGYVDLSRLQRSPYSHLDIAADLRQFFHSQGIDEVEVFAGTQPDRPLVEFTTNSEGAVLQTLTAGANALLRLRERFPQKVGALEMVMKTSTREKAGQFVLSSDLATSLVAKKVDLTAFFVDNVQF
ncbi:MAG TPA: hypothetical protein VHR45_07120 [Thermoanaerobaculia bacterium]|nr:hypothetical protein [Thermoanaerobaculia bacterium]